MKAVTTGGTENGLKKEERHDRNDSAHDQARKEPVPSHNLQENSQAGFFQIDTTTARRNQPGKDRAYSDKHREGEAREGLHKPAKIPHKGKFRRGQE